jgi:hypothetical protein
VRTTKRAVKRKVTPKPVRQLKRTTFVLTHPVEAAEGKVEDAVVGALRGRRKPPPKGRSQAAARPSSSKASPPPKARTTSAPRQTKAPPDPTLRLLPLQLALVVLHALQLLLNGVALVLLLAYGGPRTAAWFARGGPGERPDVKTAPHAEWLVLLYAACAAGLFLAGIAWAGIFFAVITGVGVLALPFAFAAQRADRRTRAASQDG